MTRTARLVQRWRIKSPSTLGILVKPYGWCFTAHAKVPPLQFKFAGHGHSVTTVISSRRQPERQLPRPYSKVIQ